VCTSERVEQAYKDFVARSEMRELDAKDDSLEFEFQKF
jgi:hypothetical protein